MKIAVSFTLEVDPATWNADYGDDLSAAQIRRLILQDADFLMTDGFAHIPYLTVKGHQ